MYAEECVESMHELYKSETIIIENKPDIMSIIKKINSINTTQSDKSDRKNVIESLQVKQEITLNKKNKTDSLPAVTIDKNNIIASSMEIVIYIIFGALFQYAFFY